MGAIEDFSSSIDPFGSTITQMYPMFANTKKKSKISKNDDINCVQLSLKPGPSHITVSDFVGEDTDDQSEIQEEEKC
jgi:hypothetical protein